MLAEKGEGEKAVREYIKKHSRQRNGYMAMQTVRQIHSPIRYEELIEIAMVWVEAALRLEAKDLRMIERLVRAQNRRMELGSEQRAAAQHVA
jgi:DSF synthase